MAASGADQAAQDDGHHDRAAARAEKIQGRRLVLFAHDD